MEVWIGLSDIGEKNRWEWSDGEPLGFTNWQAGHPNKDWDPNHAVTIWSPDGTWWGEGKAYDDGFRLPYVCAQRATPGAR